MSRYEEIATKKEEIMLAIFIASMAAFTAYCAWLVYSSWRWIFF